MRFAFLPTTVRINFTTGFTANPSAAIAPSALSICAASADVVAATAATAAACCCAVLL